jgi:hypothetical protein
MTPNALVILKQVQDNGRRRCVILKQVQDDENAATKNAATKNAATKNAATKTRQQKKGGNKKGRPISRPPILSMAGILNQVQDAAVGVTSVRRFRQQQGSSP